MPHLAQIGRVQRKRGIDPQIGDLQQLVEIDRVDNGASTEGGLPRASCPLVFANEFVDGLDPLTGFGNNVDHAQRMHLLGAVDTPTDDHSLGLCRTEAAGKKVVGAHAGKQVEQDLRKPELRLPLGDDNLLGKSDLEAAAECISLDQSNGTQGQFQIGGEAILPADTRVGICPQPFAISSSDRIQKHAQIAAEIEDSGCS